MKGQMLPIKGASKAKRLAWRAPQNQNSWAYIKMLREGNSTVKVHDVNPYVEVYRFYDNLYGLFNQNCDGGGDVWMWLVIGPKKAMLIDSAFGLGNMKGLVDKLTGGMPLIVANTHAGAAHVLGNCRFEKVYCHEYDHENIKNMCKPGGWDFLSDKNGNNTWLQFDKKDLPVYKNYELVAVKDGYTFNLGGDYNVELIWTAGHTPGHAMYLDKKSRYLFAGDDVCSDVTGCGDGPGLNIPNGQYANLTTYRDCLKKLVARLKEYDYIFPGHFIVNVENHLLVDILDTLNEIIAKPDSYSYKVEEASNNNGPKRERMHKYIMGATTTQSGFGTIAYAQNGIYPSKG